LSISDQVCVMHDGMVQQVGTPWDVYNRPSNRFVAAFVGANNFVPLGRDAAGHSSLLGQALGLPTGLLAKVAAAGCVAAIRPENLAVNQPLPGSGLRTSGLIRQAMFTGRELQLSIEVAGHGLLDALVKPDEAMMALKPGQAVELTVHQPTWRFSLPGRHRGVTVMMRQASRRHQQGRVRLDFWSGVMALALAVVSCCWSGRSCRCCRWVFSTRRPSGFTLANYLKVLTHPTTWVRSGTP
jgi:hypothetical protein